MKYYDGITFCVDIIIQMWSMECIISHFFFNVSIYFAMQLYTLWGLQQTFRSLADGGFKEHICETHFDKAS